jgi:hypothetical protein
MFAGHPTNVTNGYNDKDLSDEVSSDVNAETRPSVIRVRQQEESRVQAARNPGTLKGTVALDFRPIFYTNKSYSG